MKHTDRGRAGQCIHSPRGVRIMQAQSRTTPSPQRYGHSGPPEARTLVPRRVIISDQMISFSTLTRRPRRTWRYHIAFLPAPTLSSISGPITAGSSMPRSCLEPTVVYLRASADGDKRVGRTDWRSKARGFFTFSGRRATPTSSFFTSHPAAFVVLCCTSRVKMARFTVEIEPQSEFSTSELAPPRS